MNTPLRLGFTAHNKAMSWFMSIVWMLIAVKCIVVWWAIVHWRVPFNPLWIIAPTLVFAAVATLLWLTHKED